MAGPNPEPSRHHGPWGRDTTCTHTTRQHGCRRRVPARTGPAEPWSRVAPTCWSRPAPPRTFRPHASPANSSQLAKGKSTSTSRPCCTPTRPRHHHAPETTHVTPERRAPHHRRARPFIYARLGFPQLHYRHHQQSSNRRRHHVRAVSANCNLQPPPLRLSVSDPPPTPRRPRESCS
jgi:hypothetical protein